ncbi:uncharacterized protein I206_106238 [Kwoniella pini CBS 10737]|uniref:Peroxin-5 n=1 Tax=Kwoniella pini CBS 10737 TaxID=1296096 RepID=A0AAJ8MRZ9_9TREE
MSTFFSGGGVECGPSNVLKDVKGRLDKDRSLQYDRLVSVSNVAGSSKQSFRSVPSAQTHSKVAPSNTQAQSTFDLASLRQHLSPPPASQQYSTAHSGSWADAFGAYAQAGPSRPQQATAAQPRHSNAWGAEFAHNAGPSQVENNQSQSRALNQPIAPWKRPIYQPTFPHLDAPFTLPHMEQKSIPIARQDSVSPNQTTSQTAPVQETPVSESQDLLARTARNIMNELGASSGIMKSNPKLAQSKFVSMLKGLGDGSLVVDEGVQATGEEVGEGARLVDYRMVHGDGNDWASNFMNDRVNISEKSEEVENEQTVYPRSMTNNTLGFAPGVMPALDYTRLNTPVNGQPSTIQTQWDSHFQDQEALIRSSENLRKSVHFDSDPLSGKDKSGVPNNLEEALRHTTGIPGSGAQWEQEEGLDIDLDDVDALDDFNDEVFMGFNGAMQQASAVEQNSAGNVQNWGQLQEDWEEYSQREPAVRAFKGMGLGDQTQRYLFQSKNPYFGVSELDNYWEAESPTLKGVLELEAAVQNSPKSYEAWYNLGLKQQENEREESAILALSKTIQLEPNHRPAYLALAVSYTNEGESEAAVTMLDKWITLGEGHFGISSPISGPAVNWNGRKGREDLIERLIDIARKNPEELDAEVQVALGVLFNATEEYQKAEDCFLSALSVRPDDWLLYNRLGATLANSGRSNEAIQYYHKALEIHPNFVRALFNLGISYVNLGQYPLAAQSALDALRLQHSDLSEGFGQENKRSKGVTSDALWNVLRSACIHMNRHDLIGLVEQHDLSGFPTSFSDVLTA